VERGDPKEQMVRNNEEREREREREELLNGK